MEWKRKDNGDWEAVGKNGDFLLWKTKSGWNARYRSSSNKNYIIHFKPCNSLLEAKNNCSRQTHWEDKEKPLKRDLKAENEILKQRIKELEEEIKWLRRFENK